LCCSIFSFLCGVSLTLILTCIVNCIVCSSINILLLPFPCFQTCLNAIRYITKYIYQCINQCIHYTQYTTQQLHYAFNSFTKSNSIVQNGVDWIWIAKLNQSIKWTSMQPRPLLELFSDVVILTYNVAQQQFKNRKQILML
jgi:hypothetical protein